MLGLLYLLSDLLQNSNGSILPGAFLWKNAIGGYLPELLGRMGEVVREEERGGGGGDVERGVKRVFESWIKWDVWEESKGEYLKGCYYGTNGGEGGDGTVTDYEDPIDGEEMTEPELLEFGLDLR